MPDTDQPLLDTTVPATAAPAAPIAPVAATAAPLTTIAPATPPAIPPAAPAIEPSHDGNRTEASDEIEIPENWIELQWKQVVVLAKRISGAAELTFDDAKQVILNELDLRAAPEGDDGLVEMTKDGESLRVNPTTVEAHKKVGWKLA